MPIQPITLSANAVHAITGIKTKIPTEPKTNNFIHQCTQYMTDLLCLLNK